MDPEHEMAVVAHLTAMAAHTFAVPNEACVVDTSPLLVTAYVHTEQQDVCGFNRTPHFVEQLNTLKRSLTIDTQGVYILLAGQPEMQSPDYEMYVSAAAHHGATVVHIDPTGMTAAEVADRIGAAIIAPVASSNEYI